MTTISKEIFPGQGLGAIRFGMTREQVKDILGEATEISKEEVDHLYSEIWHYDRLELSASFDEAYDWRLTSLSVTATDYLLSRQQLMGLQSAQLLEELNSLGITDLEFEESPDHQLISSDEYALMFWLDEGQLSEIQWSVLFIDEETIDWPA